MNPKTPRHGDQWRRWAATLCSSIFLIRFLLPAGALGAVDPSLSAAHLQKRASLPMSFEPNVGQTDPQVSFMSRGRGFTIFLTSTQAVLTLKGAGSTRNRHPEAGSGNSAGRHNAATTARPNPAVLRMSLAGANPRPEQEPLDPLPGLVNYFLGQNPDEWRIGIHTYGRIRYQDVYPGIDLVYYGGQGQLEYDFVLRPGADPENIRLRFEGADGIEMDDAGGLVVHLGDGTVRWPKPVVYQDIQGIRKTLPGEYLLKGREEVAFQVRGYDPTSPLVIDPVLVYSSYLGGNNRDESDAIFVDRGGSVYLTGETTSPNFPTATPFRATPIGTNDVFVTKFNSTGTALLYSTYLGGTGNDFGLGIAVDSGGNAYVTGQTESTNFPTKNAFQSSAGGGGFSDAFLFKLGPAGSNLLYSTYFGGPNIESGNGIAVDASGKVYLAGETYSGSGFPTTFKPFQQNAGGGLDGFVAKFDPAIVGGNSLIYSGWLGGVEDERATAIAVDAAGNAYVVGEAFSFDFSTSTFPVLNALQGSYGGGGSDAFVAKINAAGSAVLFATFFGGDGEDCAFAVTLDASNNIYLTGQTSSLNFPTTLDAQQPSIGDGGYFGTMDAFVSKMPSAGSTLLYSTYLGGNIDEAGTGIAVDGSGQVYVTGETDSEDFPVTTGADQAVYGGGADDVFVAKLNPAAPGPSGLVYSSYLGKIGLDTANGIGLDTNGNFYICGQTYSAASFSTPGVFQPSFGGGFSDAFVAKFATPSDLSVSLVASPSPVIVNSNLTYTLVVNNNGRATFTGVNLTNKIPTGVQFLSLANNRGSCANSAGTITCSFGTLTNNASATVTVVVKPTSPGTLTNTATLTANEPEINTANNRPVLLTGVQGIADVAVSQVDAPDPVFVGSNLTYTITVTNKGPWPATQIMLSDYLAANVDFISATASQGDYSFGFGSILFDLGTLAANSSATATVVVSPSTLTPVTNQVVVSAFDVDPSTANNTSIITTAVTPYADLAVSAIASPSPVVVGNNLTNTIIVTNQGPLNASSVVLTNRLPSGPIYVSAIATQGSCSRSGNTVSCSLGTINNGASVKVTIVTTPTAEGLLTNVINVSSSSAEPGTTDNIVTNIASAVLLADAAVSISDAPDPVNVGSNLVYSILVTNRGFSTLNGISLSDTLPGGVNFVSATPSQGSCSRVGGVVTCSLGSLPSQVGAVITVTVTPPTPGFLTNIASVTISGTDNNLANNSATNVTRANTPPTISSIGNQTISEDTIAGPIAFTVGDAETAAASLTIAAVSSNTGLVASAGFAYGGSGTSRNVSIVPLTNQFGTATITVSVTDGDGARTSSSFLLTVNAVNDPPTFDQLPDLTINEDSGLQILPLTGIGPGPANESSQIVSIASSNSNRSLLTNVTVSYTPPGSTASLSFGTVSNASGTAVITVTANDGGGANNLFSRTFTVVVNPVNDAPTLSPLPDLFLQPNAGQQILALNGISAGPLDEASQAITISATSSRPLLLPNPVVTYSSPNSSGSLRLNPAPDTTGNATITVTVQDDGGTGNGGQNTLVRTFLLTVTSPPVLRVARTDNFVLLSWPTNVAGFALEGRQGLSNTGSWLPVTNAPAVTGNQYVVTNILGGANAFFRLRSP